MHCGATLRGMSREELTQMARSLLAFHKALMDAGVQRHEAEHGPVGGPLKMYSLLTESAEFAWLRPLSSLAARIDEAIDDREHPPGPGTVEGFREQVSQLLAGEVSPEFRAGYGPHAELSTVRQAEARVRAGLARGMSA